MWELLALRAQTLTGQLSLPWFDTWLDVQVACIACTVAVSRPVLCELMSNVNIPEEGREDAGEGHLGGLGWGGGGRGGSRIGSPLTLHLVMSYLSTVL